MSTATTTALTRATETLEDAAADLEEQAAEAGWDGRDDLERELLRATEQVRELQRQFRQRLAGEYANPKAPQSAR